MSISYALWLDLWMKFVWPTNDYTAVAVFRSRIPKWDAPNFKSHFFVSSKQYLACSCRQQFVVRAFEINAKNYVLINAHTLHTGRLKYQRTTRERMIEPAWIWIEKKERMQTMERAKRLVTIKNDLTVHRLVSPKRKFMQIHFLTVTSLNLCECGSHFACILRICLAHWTCEIICICASWCVYYIIFVCISIGHCHFALLAVYIKWTMLWAHIQNSIPKMYAVLYIRNLLIFRIWSFYPFLSFRSPEL